MQNLFTSHASTSSQATAEVLKSQLRCASTATADPQSTATQPSNGHGLFCFCVECRPFSPDHQDFTQDMPSDPEDLMDDFFRMGLIKSEAVEVAEAVSSAELRQLLFYKNASNGDPAKEKLLRALAEEAGGLDQAMSAAFGPQAGDFFASVHSSSPFGRRSFLKGLAAGAAMITIANGAGLDTQDSHATDASGGKLEKTNLKIGFIPITCATPIIMSEPMGFYKSNGLKCKVVKMPSWGAVRDSAIAG